LTDEEAIAAMRQAFRHFDAAFLDARATGLEHLGLSAAMRHLTEAVLETKREFSDLRKRQAAAKGTTAKFPEMGPLTR